MRVRDWVVHTRGSSKDGPGNFRRDVLLVFKTCLFFCGKRRQGTWGDGGRRLGSGEQRLLEYGTGGRLWWRRLLRWWGLDRLYCRECELKGAREYFRGCYGCRLCCRGWVF